jgi:MYXO-CTERM domain-containing protein
MRSRLLSFVAVALLGGCTSEFTFTDSVNSRFLERAPRAEFGDELSTPYVLGARFTTYIEDREGDANFAGWTVRVADPGVLALREEAPRWVDAHTLALELEAVGEGTTELLLLDPSGEVQGSASAEVRAPTRAQLFASAIAALEDEDFRGETPHPQILTGGTASFVVQYLADDLRLQGSTQLEVATTAAIEAVIQHSRAADNRDIVQISAGEPGLEALELWVGGVQLQRVEVDVVGPEAVAAIDLIHRKGASSAESEGDWLVVAQAYDELRDPVYGVGFGWDLEGQTFEQAGDVLVYAHDAERENLKTVTAWAGGIEASMSIYAADAEVFTSNDDAFNCNVDGGRAAPWWALVLLLGLGRRRRRS